MKKILVIASIILVLLFVIFYNGDIDNEVRIRVIANSNSVTDQTIKNEVVKIVKDVINADDTYDEVANKKDFLSECIKKFAQQINTQIKVEFKRTNFPAKSMNGKVIPAGVYQTLLITIGNGNGNNYWSLLYPEYYGITFEEIDSENVFVKSYFYELFNK